MSIKRWTVQVNTSPDRTFYLGEVFEENEELARCAALSKWGISEEDEFIEVHEGVDGPIGILPEDGFSVFAR